MPPDREVLKKRIQEGINKWSEPLTICKLYEKFIKIMEKCVEVEGTFVELKLKWKF